MSALSRSISLVLAVLALVALTAGSVSAQPHPGGLMLGGGVSTLQLAYTQGIVHVDRTTGVMTTAVDLTVNKESPGFMQATTMDIDNRSLVFGPEKIGTGYTLKQGLFTVDPATDKFKTIVSTTAFQNVSGIVIDQDGDYIVNAGGWVNAIYESAVYRVTPSGAISTLLTTQQFNTRFSFQHRMVRDLATGKLLIPVNGTLGTVARPVLALSRDGTVSTWHSSATGFLPANGSVQHLGTGALFSFFNGVSQSVMSGSTPRVRQQIGNRNGYPIDLIAIDNQSQANPQLLGYMHRNQSNETLAAIVWVDPATNAVTKTLPFIQSNALQKIPYFGYDLFNEHARYIQTVKTGNRKWDMHLSLPAFPGKNYGMAATMAGIRPGITLLDGRKIWLNPDVLFLVTATNQFAPVFNPGPGTLDANGRAKGSLDFSFLPPQLSIRFHMALAVVDSQAPSGLAFITEPVPHIL